MIEQRTYVSDSACVGACNLHPNCAAAVIDSDKCFIVSNKSIFPFYGRRTAFKGATCPGKESQVNVAKLNLIKEHVHERGRAFSFTLQIQQELRTLFSICQRSLDFPSYTVQ